MSTSSNAPVFLVSPPRLDWTIRGRANVFANASTNGVPPPSAEAARADWLTVVNAIEAAGGVCAVVDNTADLLLTGLPYCAEAGLCAVDPADNAPVFVLPNLTPPHRQREPDVIAPAVRQLGLRTISLPTDVKFEGQGDVIAVGNTLVCTSGVGPWARSGVDAFDHYARFLDRPALHLGFHADPWFHGNTFLGAYEHNGRVVVIVCFDALRDDGADRLRAFVDGAAIVSIDAAATLTYATNALQVGTTVLAPAGVPDVVIDAWRALGLTVQLLELPALFRKGGGAAVCLTNRLDGVRAGQVPHTMQLSTWKAAQA
jgi:N-dimethylarginine dimethylaminohydrolase